MAAPAAIAVGSRVLGVNAVGSEVLGAIAVGSGVLGPIAVGLILLGRFEPYALASGVRARFGFNGGTRGYRRRLRGAGVNAVGAGVLGVNAVGSGVLGSIAVGLILLGRFEPYALGRV